MNLHIVDISPHIYAGAVNKRAVLEGPLRESPSGFSMPAIESGGIAFLFNKIYDFGRDGMMVFCGDRNATIKKGMQETYKATRNYNSSIETQKEIVEDVLAECGYQVFAEDGYEADDFIWALCNKYKKDFDHIYVHTDDSDLFIVVDKNVSILPARKSGKIVTYENYKTHARKDALTEYNSIPMIKVIWGDTSDHVKALPKDLQTRMYSAFFNDFYYPKMANKAFMRAAISATFPEAISNFDIIYPLDVEVSIDEYAKPDLNLTPIWGKLVGNNRFPAIRVVPDTIGKKVEAMFNGQYETI